MAKLPLRFLLAIPVAVIGQLGFGNHASADEVAGLLAASNEEMAYKGHIEGFAADAPQKDWEEYSDTSRIINDYIELANAGEPPDATEWHRALGEVGAARNVLTANAEVGLNQRIAATAA